MENRNVPRAGELYRHFKDKLYQIVTIATHSETGESMVVYQALYDDYRVYVRPLGMFMSEVDHEKYPDITQKYRFEKISVADGMQEKTEDKEEEQTEPSSGRDMAAESLIKFLDADTYAEKLNLLREMKKTINDKMAYDMAVSLDIVLKEGALEEKIKDLENCLKTYARFECNRFR